MVSVTSVACTVAGYVLCLFLLAIAMCWLTDAAVTKLLRSLDIFELVISFARHREAFDQWRRATRRE